MLNVSGQFYGADGVSFEIVCIKQILIVRMLDSGVSLFVKSTIPAFPSDLNPGPDPLIRVPGSGDRKLKLKIVNTN